MGAQPADQPQTDTTRAISNQASGTTNQISPALINALVELLQKRIG
jgi:hypothetical protein